MQHRTRVNRPVATLYFGLMILLGFMVLVGPSAASAVSANVYVYGEGIYGESQAQYGNIEYGVSDFVASEWSVYPFTLTGPTISQPTPSSFKMSGMTLTCTYGEVGCGPITIEAYLGGVTNPGVFSVDLDGTYDMYNPGLVATDSSGYLDGSYWAYTYLGNSQVGVSGNFSVAPGDFAIPTVMSPDLSVIGSPFNMVFGIMIYGMNYGDSLTLANSFNINVNTPTSVPEPSSAALFAGGLVALGYLRRRMYKRN